MYLWIPVSFGGQMQSYQEERRKILTHVVNNDLHKLCGEKKQLNSLKTFLQNIIFQTQGA